MLPTVCSKGTRRIWFWQFTASQQLFSCCPTAEYDFKSVSYTCLLIRKVLHSFLGFVWVMEEDSGVKGRFFAFTSITNRKHGRNIIISDKVILVAHAFLLLFGFLFVSKKYVCNFGVSARTPPTVGHAAWFTLYGVVG